MKRMKRILALSIIFLSLFFTQKIFSQELIDTQNPGFRAKWEKFDFQGKISAAALEDETNNYYLVDYSSLTTLFEKIYFVNLSFKNETITNIDSDIKQRCVWYLSNKKYPVADVLKIFDDLKTKTAEASAKMTENEKEVWLKANNKYF